MTPEPNRKKIRTLSVLIFCTFLCMGAQAASFLPVFSKDFSFVSTDIVTANLPPGYSVEDYVKAEEFNRPFGTAVLFRRMALVLGLLALIVSGVSYWYDTTFGAGWGRWPARFFFFFLISLGFQIISAPYQVAGYYHSLAFGISALSWGEWIRIKLIEYPVPMILFVFQGLIIYCLMHLFGKRWWVAAAVFIFLLGMVPEFITYRPIELVASLEPLGDERYRNELDEVGRAAGFTLEMFVEDRSTRATTTNVYLGGRASDRFVVLTDTFLENFTPGEAVAALAHELGHIENEVPALIIHKGLTFLTLSAAFLAAYRLTGRKRIVSGSCLQAVVITLACLLCAEYLFQPVRCAIRRWEERKADEYGLRLTGDPKSFTSLLVKGARINLVQLKTASWHYYLFLSYPDVAERITWAQKT